MAFFAEAIARIEEERAKALTATIDDPSARPSAHADLLPEAARFLDVVVSGENRNCTRIYCGRFAHERSGELELLEFMGTGFPMSLQSLGHLVTDYHC